MLTQARLKELLWFNNETGRLHWIRTSGRGIKKSKNGEAGSFDSHGYGQVRVDGKIYKEHRLVWLYVHGEFPRDQIDHINHQRRDNRIENLRLVDGIGNAMNRPRQRNNSTGFPGVSLNKSTGKFRAYINQNGVRTELGNFSNIEDAVAARKQKELELGFSELHGVGLGRRKHKPLRFATYEEFQLHRRKERRERYLKTNS